MLLTIHPNMILISQEIVQNQEVCRLPPGPCTTDPTPTVLRSLTPVMMVQLQPSPVTMMVETGRGPRNRTAQVRLFLHAAQNQNEMKILVNFRNETMKKLEEND